jgi:hypothetical protein
MSLIRTLTPPSRIWDGRNLSTVSVALMQKVLHLAMPTTRPRHMITETDQLSDALTEAAKIWPELSGQRTLLLRKVLEVGIESIEAQATKRTKSRWAKVQKLAGSMDGVWPANWRDELDQDWPR